MGDYTVHIRFLCGKSLTFPYFSTVCNLITTEASVMPQHPKGADELSR